MKKKIMQAFKTLGFRLEKFDDDGYGLKYEGTKYLWTPSEDEDFLLITAPSFFDASEVDELSFLKTIDKFNATIKYVKANAANGTLWVNYERELFDDDPETLESILTSMVVRLDASLKVLNQMLSELIDCDDDDSGNARLLIDDIEDLDVWEEVEDIND